MSNGYPLSHRRLPTVFPHAGRGRLVVLQGLLGLGHTAALPPLMQEDLRSNFDPGMYAIMIRQNKTIMEYHGYSRYTAHTWYVSKESSSYYTIMTS